MFVKFTKKKTDKIEGGIIELSRPVHISNVSLICPEKYSHQNWLQDNEGR